MYDSLLSTGYDVRFAYGQVGLVAPPCQKQRQGPAGSSRESGIKRLGGGATRRCGRTAWPLHYM
jgi:hypothetical protein